MGRSFGRLWGPCLLVALLGAPAFAGGGEQEKICAQAWERYQDIAPELPPEDGVIVVLMYKYTFCPADLEVPEGAVLRWVNVDKRTSHSVWFKEDGGEESERLFPDEYVEMTLSKAGRFNYICGPHWEQENMRAAITVTP